MTTRRGVLAAGVGAFAGCIGGGGSAEQYTPPGGPVANVPIPDAPGEHTYALAGSGDADLTVTYVGNWKCPYCADFSTGFLGDLVTEYVEPGRIDLQFRNLTYTGGGPFLGPDTPSAARAGLAVWDATPGAYWPYHELVMANQPAESKRWATADRLAGFAEGAGADPGAVREAIRENGYERALRATTEFAANNGVRSTPTLVIAGESVNPLGEQGEERTRDLIEGALGA